MVQIIYTLYIIGILFFILLVGYIARRFTIQKKCPYCSESDNIERIKRPWMLKRMFLFFDVKKYICYKCYKPHFRLVRNGK
jgi:hypothetical protein